MSKENVSVTLRVADVDHCKRFKDPFDPNLHHLETLLPFSEVNKLVPGTANVRKPKENSKPYRNMLETARKHPRSFHLKNRGITFLCSGFLTTPESNGKRSLTIELAKEDEDLNGGEIDEARKAGIGDGGHTYAVIDKIVQEADQLRANDPTWVEPFVRVRFSTSNMEWVTTEDMVEALNTSTQVKDWTMDEYRRAFEPLKKAFAAAGFDVSNIIFKENDPGHPDWKVEDILQRLACFLRSKSDLGPRLYKSKGRARQLFKDEKTQPEFLALSNVITDVTFLPEFIESKLKDSLVERNRFGGLRVATERKAEFTYPSIGYKSKYQMDLAATLPLAGAFRELLELNPKTGKEEWIIDWREAFRRAADDLYRTLVDHMPVVNVGRLGSDPAYWTAAANVILRVKSEILTERLSRKA